MAPAPELVNGAPWELGLEHDPRGCAVAISGGGHRATILALGALMALVDRGVNRHVQQVSSVSGGSITNGLIAHRGMDFQLADTDQFDDLAADLAGSVINRGVLNRGWTLAFLAVVAASCAAGTVAGVLLSLPSAITVLVAVMAALTPLLGFGRFVQWRLRRVYFGKGPRTLANLPASKVEHVFCATDLISGLPVYVTTWARGRLWRRTRDSLEVWGSMGQMWDAEKLQIDEVVRASAGFPGIPPRRLKVGSGREGRCSRRLDSPSSIRDDRNPLALGGWTAVSAYDTMMATHALPVPGQAMSELQQWAAAVDAWERDGKFGDPPKWQAGDPLPWDEVGLKRRTTWPRTAHTMFLSDGGISNNLGVQALREDGLFRAEVNGTWHPRLMLSMNSSAPMQLRSERSFYLPGAALVSQLVRCMQVLSTNTVIPRVMASMAAAGVRAHAGMIDNTTDMTIDLAADPHSFGLTMRNLAVVRRVIERRREEYNARVQLAADEGLVGWDEWDNQRWTGIIERENLDDLLASDWWTSMRKAADARESDFAVPTTLGRLDKEVVHWLLIRGYMGGYLASLAAAPWAPDEVAGPARYARDRIARIAQLPRTD